MNKCYVRNRKNGKVSEWKGTYPPSEFLDFRALAAKIGASEAWVRRNVRRTYTSDPIPHLRFGRSIRFVWDSVEMKAWLERRKAATNGKNGPAIAGRAASYKQDCTGSEQNRKERK